MDRLAGIKRAAFGLGLTTLLAACGADGEPEQPTANAAFGTKSLIVLGDPQPVYQPVDTRRG